MLTIQTISEEEFGKGGGGRTYDTEELMDALEEKYAELGKRRLFTEIPKVDVWDSVGEVPKKSLENSLKRGLTTALKNRGFREKEVGQGKKSVVGSKGDRFTFALEKEDFQAEPTEEELNEEAPEWDMKKGLKPSKVA